jgi:hypothetical protein
LAAGGNVSRTKVRDCRNPRSLGDHGRFGDLQRRPDGSDPGIFHTMRQVMHRLSMRADQVNLLRAKAGCPNHTKRGIGKPFAKQGIQMANLRNRPSRRLCQNPLLQRSGIWQGLKASGLYR